MNTIHTDVLVVGGGGAGCRAALEASHCGATVLLVLKGTIGNSGATTISASEMAGFNVPNGDADPLDSPECYFHDMMAGAAGMAIPSLVETIARQAENELQTLMDWGIPFKMDGKKPYAFKSCFSTRARTHVIPGHGEPIVRALAARLRQCDGCKVLSNTTVIDLLVYDNRCLGAIIYSDHLGLAVVYAGSVVLATGGGVQLFAQNLNPRDVTGDGYALAYRAGARLANMEFMQAGIGFSHPFQCLFPAYLWSGYPELRNGMGERFIGKREKIPENTILYAHAYHFPFSCRDVSSCLEINVQRELLEGRGSPEGGIYVRFQKFTPEYIRTCSNEFGLHTMWDVQRDYFASRKADLLNDPFQVSCFAHAVNGGILINDHAMSSIDGLFAAGEAAAGPHGADRLGGNMMVTCQIFGRIAGQSAAVYSQEHPVQKPTLQKSLLDQNRARLLRKASCSELLRQMQLLCQRDLLIVRTQEGLCRLESGLQKLQNELWSAPLGNQYSVRSIECDSLLCTALLMTRSALHRRESRGSHYRADYPKTDEAYEKMFILQP